MDASISPKMATYVFIDSCAYRHRQFAMQGRVFGSLLELIRDGHVQLLTTKITIAECRKLIRDAVGAGVSNQKKFAVEGWVLKRLPEFAPIFEKQDRPKLADRVISIFDGYLKEAGAKEVDMDAASVSRIVDQYITASPPFGPQDKKNEFPDAIVISALANWARTQKVEIHIVSRDERFREACELEDELHPLTDVSEFLTEIASHEVVASARIGKLLTVRRAELAELVRGRFANLGSYLESDVGDGDAEIGTIDQIEIQEEPSIISLDENSGIVEVECEVTCTVNLSWDDPNSGMWDSEDHVMLFVRKKRATVARIISVTAEFLLQYTSPEDLAHPDQIVIGLGELTPDLIGIEFSGEDAWQHGEHYDYDDQDEDDDRTQAPAHQT